jgi:hypothetical protein
VVPIKDFLNLGSHLTKRQKSLKTLSKKLKWSYRPDISSDPQNLEKFEYFKSKQINYQYNVLVDTAGRFSLFDLSYSEGAFISKEDLKSSFLMIKLEKQIPHFILDKEHLLASLYEPLGYKDIDFVDAPDFSRRFFLSGKNRSKIREWFTPELIFFFESHSYFHIETNKDIILIKGKNRLSSIDEIKKMLSFGTELTHILKK